MNKPLTQVLQEKGVVGAGGAGFPAYVKIAGKPEFIIANGAECEPLLRVDRQLMETQAHKIVQAMEMVMLYTGATKGVVCLKKKYHAATDALEKEMAGKTGISVYQMDNYYPAGDEQQMVYEVTGKVVPPGGLPGDCGALVQNVSTLINIYDAAINDLPVINRSLTVTGEVANPVTITVPLGTSFADCVMAAGGPAPSERYSLIIGGPAMGYVENDWSQPVTKTTSGIIVLKSDHYLIKVKTTELEREATLARAVCCQCNFCTILCPRNALGLKVEPHKMMRAIGLGDMSLAGDPEGIISCCDCGICTYYACNFGLTPSRFMNKGKRELLQGGFKSTKTLKHDVDKARDILRVPADRFLKRLNVEKYDVDAPLKEGVLEVQSVRIPLRQHIGVPAEPVVQPGDHVSAGTVIAVAPPGKLSVNIHASITGTVTSVTVGQIEIKSAN